MRVMLIPEDFRHDQYVITPLFKRLFYELGKPHAKVLTCTDPLLGGIGEAMKPERLEEIFAQYDGMVDIFILCVDRDAETGRKAKLESLEQRFNVDGRVFFTVAAIEEIETWLLAGLADELVDGWQAIRGEVHPKEVYFIPLVEKLGLQFSPGQGRKILGERSARNCSAIVQKCQEDLGALVGKINGAIAA